MSNAGIAKAPWTSYDAHGRDREMLLERVRELEAERERLMEHLLHLERIAQVGLMTAGLAHDLTNQLTSVAGSAELALMRAHPEALREGLREVLDHAGRMDGTLDAFLSFVRRREHRVRVVPIAEVVDAVQRLLEPVARSESVVLLSSVTTQRCLRADRQLLEQALVNLISNAIRAAAAGGGRVAITAADIGDGRVRLSVRDTGGGIPASVRDRLFEPFVTGNAESGGHGLGMFVVRQVVAHYQGTITVDTSAAGTRIDVDLPSCSALGAGDAADAV